MTIFRGEMQLLRWSDTSTNGATVTFQLADVRDLDKFKELTLAKKGMAGQIIAAIMVKVDDEPAPEVAPAAAPEPKTKPGELCIMACTFCAMRDFRDWASNWASNPVLVESEEDAKSFILETCGVTSRKELDTDKMAAIRFHTVIREPFLRWKQQP